jgi:riboflavin biosynthesis pyrimidine reductase
MIGVNTLIHDTPRLNVRQPLFEELLTKNPRPIVLDSSLKLLEIDSILLQNPLVFTCISPTDPRFQAAVEKLNGMGGGQVIHCLANQFGR